MSAFTPSNQEEQLAEQLVLQMLANALEEQSSHIHLEPLRDQTQVRFRLEEGLETVSQHSAQLGRAARQVLKKMCHTDPQEETVPQDGRILISHDETEVEVRMSTFPTALGERMVLRIQDGRRNELLTQQGLASLDLLPEQRPAVEELIFAPFGLVLLTGLIGSGKSDTAYAAMSSLVRRSEGRSNIISVEKPIETFIPGVAQNRVSPQGLMDFSQTLRGVLRQDPDAIFSSAVPDAATARELLKAALTGHLAVAQFNAADAPSALFGFLQLGLEGVELHHLCLVLRGLTCQRMARRMCTHCRRPGKPSARQLAVVLAEIGHVAEVFVAPGCQRCKHTGFRGRVNVYETLMFTPQLGQMLSSGASLEAVREHLRASGHVSLVGCGIRAAAAGLVSLEEALRATA
jgi:general secretion pathway protein E